MELKNESYQKLNAAAAAGKYTKQSTGGRPFWKSYGDENAIWFHDKKWRIGPVEVINTSSNHFWGTDETLACPESDKDKWYRWDYEISQGFKAGDDLKIISYSGACNQIKNLIVISILSIPYAVLDCYLNQVKAQAQISTPLRNMGFLTITEISI